YALEYYRNYSSIDYEKTGAPFFKYIQSINLLYNYIRNFLYLNFHDLVQIIIKNVLGSNRSLKERLERAYACLEETEEAIRRLDLSMSPDSEDGKLFQRLRYSLGTDPGHHKIFMGLVVQKDQDVKGILDQGLENLNALAKVLEEVEGITTSEGKIQLSTHYMIQGQSDKLCRHIDARREHMDRFRGFFQQIYKHEKTSH
ncbi:MAG: hypothetical protein LBQ61_00470, partial [Spirochaetales bacterium]|nr:hypothetical protein [Spirochaetales bacterium]